jgi:hypothetical protein
MIRASMKIAALALIVASSLGMTAADQDHVLCKGFLPPNNMKIPVGWKSTRIGSMANGGLNETQFNAVLDRIEKLYGPVVAQAGGKLRINRKWTDPTVNASAQQFNGTWVLNMYGGLARHPEITTEGFALVACHELGHHLGGAPKIDDWYGDNWATNEGGADYYATLKCLRRFFAEDDNTTIIANSTIDDFAKGQCLSQFTSEQDQLLCMRNSLAGDSVAGLFMDLRKEPKRPKYDTPDTNVVGQMDDEHPGTQCRMDTYLAGAVCHVDQSVPLSNTDYHEGSCAAPTDTVGTRPLCWFKP